MSQYFFIARRTDGTPLFLHNQSFMGKFDEFQKKFIQVLSIRPDVNHITVHRITADPEHFEFVSVEIRDGKNGFHPCSTCARTTHEHYNCDHCGSPGCPDHRKADPRKFMKKLCLNCYTELYPEQEKEN